MSLNEYLKAQNKTNDAIRTSTFSADELDRFSKSDYRWADNRSKHFRHREVKKRGNISIRIWQKFSTGNVLRTPRSCNWN